MIHVVILLNPMSDARCDLMSQHTSHSLPPTMASQGSPTATLADPALQGDVDKRLEQSQSDNADPEIISTKDFGFIPIPRHLRYDLKKPFYFGLSLNIGFGFASTFSELYLHFN